MEFASGRRASRGPSSFPGTACHSFGDKTRTTSKLAVTGAQRASKWGAHESTGRLSGHAGSLRGGNLDRLDATGIPSPVGPACPFSAAREGVTATELADPVRSESPEAASDPRKRAVNLPGIRRSSSRGSALGKSRAALLASGTGPGPITGESGRALERRSRAGHDEDGIDVEHYVLPPTQLTGLREAWPPSRPRARAARTISDCLSVNAPSPPSRNAPIEVGSIALGPMVRDWGRASARHILIRSDLESTLERRCGTQSESRVSCPSAGGGIVLRDVSAGSIGRCAPG